MNLGNFAQALSYCLLEIADAKHTAAYRHYRMNDCDDDLYDEVEKWGRLADLATDYDIETNDLLYQSGRWLPKGIAA